MLVYRGMDIGTAKPTAAQRARVPHHLIDLAEPSERFSVARFQAIARRRSTDVAARGRAGVAGGRIRPLPAGGGRRTGVPAGGPRRRARSWNARGRDGHRAPLPAPAASDPAAAPRSSPANLRRVIRALEVAAITGRRFSSFGAAWDVYDPATASAPPASGWTRDPRDRIARPGARRCSRGAGSRRSGVSSIAGWGGWLTSTQAIGYSEFVCAPRGRLGLDEAVERTERERATSPGARWHGSGVIHGSAGSRPVGWRDGRRRRRAGVPAAGGA